MRKLLLFFCFIALSLAGLSLEKKLSGTSGAGRWLKIARIQNRQIIDGGEYAQFSGRLNIQTDYGQTGTAQYHATFSFGSRGGIRPLLFEMGDAARRGLNDPSRMEWRIYKAPDGYHYLWMYQSNYCKYAVFDYQVIGCVEYWTYENPPADYQMIWESFSGDRQSFTAPLKNPMVEGRMGIGVKSPSCELDVVGTIKANEIKVIAQTADFVFEPDYNLRPLNEVEVFVKENKHLPEIPSAKQMETEGVNVAEMNKLLLQKVEELTLYLLEQNKKMNDQSKRIDTLTEQVQKLQ